MWVSAGNQGPSQPFLGLPERGLDRGPSSRRAPLEWPLLLSHLQGQGGPGRPQPWPPRRAEQSAK